MSQEDEFRDLQEQAAAAALKAYRAGQVPASDDELILNDFQAEYQRATQYPSGCWMHSPANLEVFSLTIERLQRNAVQRGIEGKVTKVRAAKLRNKKYIYIYATANDDPNGIQVNYQRYGAWINLITLLGPLKLTEKTGYRARYDLDYAGEDSPVGPALVLNLGRRLERRQDWKSAKKSKTEGEKKSKTEGEKRTQTEGEKTE